MKKTKDSKAITLISLIITIVSLLILATVAINSITQYIIIENVNNAVKEYENVASIEKNYFDNYTSELDQTLTGSGNGGNSGSSEIEFSKIIYRIGDLVEVKGEIFYVIKECTTKDTNVVILARECIHTENLLQGPSSSINTVAFSKTNYWSTIEKYTIPI